MSDSIKAQDLRVTGTNPSTQKRMTLGITLSGGNGNEAGALAALRTLIEEWAAKYGVKPDFDGPRPE